MLHSQVSLIKGIKKILYHCDLVVNIPLKGTACRKIRQVFMRDGQALNSREYVRRWPIFPFHFNSGDEQIKDCAGEYN